MNDNNKSNDIVRDMNYTVEKHTQILISLLKAHNIRKIIASPGSTNICFVGSLQNDPFFRYIVL